MSSRTLTMTDALYDWMLRVSVSEPDVLRRLREETQAMPEGEMQISPEQGQLMRLLVELVGARRTVEVGTFTGYSALCVALALPPEGRLVACDSSEEYTSVARRYWDEAGVAAKIDLRIGPAEDTLRRMVDDGQAGTFDFAFIDADKPAQRAYYELCLELVRPGGLIALDNALWGGSVADPGDERASTRHIREIDEAVARDPRVTSSLVPIGDGLLLARRR